MRKFLVLTCMAVMVFAAPSAYAVATLQLFDGVNTVTVADSNADGVVTYNGAVGTNWTVNVSTGLTYPTLGSTNFAWLDLNSVNNSIGAGTLTIKFSEVGFTALQPVQMATGGTTSSTGTFDFKAYYNSNNALLGTSTLIGDLGTFGGPSFSGNAVFASSTTTPYSITEVVTITQTGAGVASFDAQVKAVPEPGTMLLLGSGLVGLAGWGRKKFRK